MRILITGAGGFIGSHLVDSQLAKGFDVRAVDLHLDLLRLSTTWRALTWMFPCRMSITAASMWELH